MADESDDLLVTSRRERSVLTTMAVLIGVVILALGLYFAFAVGHLFEPEETLIQTSSSPDGKWVVEVYDISGGARGHSAMLARARPAGGGVAHEILRLDPLRNYSLEWNPSKSPVDNTVVIKWLSPTTLLLGGIPVTVDSQQ